MTSLQMADRLKGSEKNVWVEFGKLAAECKAINLGMGCPDFKPPKHVVDKLLQVALSPNPQVHQYARPNGCPHLVNSLTRLYKPLMDRDIDAMTEVIIGVGAFGVLFNAIHGLINPGDEVIIIEPFFDCYERMVHISGGTPVFIPLRQTKTDGPLTSNDWKLDQQELTEKFSSKTKAIIVNNPNNPMGKVYRRDELEFIAELCKKHNCLVISDEVYEWMIYKGNEHVKIANLPDMWERTITIGSAGKMLSATGWKIGWGVGPANLIKAMSVLHLSSIYNFPTPLQEAVADAIDHEITVFGDPEKCYLKSLANELQPKRDMLAAALVELGMNPILPDGGYFLMTDTSKLNATVPDDGSGDTSDFQFVRWMTKQKKLSAIPPTAFYSEGDKHLAEKFTRFCFIKKDETLQAAVDILHAWHKDIEEQS